MKSYIIFCVNAIYENSKLVEFVENLYWIEAECALDAFDEATSKAKTRADLGAIAFKDKRDFLGITEVLPINNILGNGNIIGQRLYSANEEIEIMDRIMSRDDFISLESKCAKILC